MNKLDNPNYYIFSLEPLWGKIAVVCGRGDAYEYTINLLSRSKWKNKYRGVGNDWDKIANMSKNEFLLPAMSCGIDDYIVSLRNIYKNIEIFRPNGELLNASYGNQYFDVFEPFKEEVVVDCGAFDGATELEIIKWGSDRIKKIYAFEIDPQNKEKCLRCYEENGILEKVVFINKGTSCNNTQANLCKNAEGSTASRIGNGGDIVNLAKIDDEIKEHVTFIKMDVEGAELDSLRGAESILINDKPRLAICIYHKKEDLSEIPKYLLSIVPEYRFIVRQYNAKPWETVLYAYVNN